MMMNNWSIGSIDSAIAIINPQSNIRKRILVMLAILETMPEYTEMFLPRKRHPLYHFYICLVGLRVACKLIFGLLLVKII